jgi:hypothetical protein
MTTTLPEATFGDLYETILEAEGGTPPYTWQIIDGMLPKDLTLDAVDGIISGVIDEAGTFDFTIKVYDQSDPVYSDTAVFQVAVNYICGDANNDGEANVADAVFIINYTFLGGPAPVLSQAGDPNCDGEVNVADCVYLIAYVFNGGQEPCCR